MLKGIKVPATRKPLLLLLRTRFARRGEFAIPCPGVDATGKMPHAFGACSIRLLSCVDILPRPKGRGFLLDGDVFMPGMNTMARGPYATLWHGLRAAKSRENVDRGVDVAIMMGSAIGTRPFSDTQPCSTFRTATRNVSAA